MRLNGFSVKYLSLRITTISILLLLILTSCSNSKHTYTVGIISALDYFKDTAEGFKEKMTTLGYTEGININYNFQSSNFEPDKELKILQKFVEDKVDLILTFPSEVSLVAKEVTRGTGIPVVFANANIEGMNLIDSISVPGGNITGVRYPGPDITIKRLEILMELMPDAQRFLVAYQEGYPIVAAQLEALDIKINEVGRSLIKIGAKDTSDLRLKLDSIKVRNNMKPDAVLLIAEPLTISIRGFPIIGKFAKELGIVVGGAEVSFGQYRSLFSVCTDNRAVGSQAALLANKIFNGIPAGTIPVVSAENYIVYDLIAAAQYGIELDEGLLKQSDKIIK